MLAKPTTPLVLKLKKKYGPRARASRPVLGLVQEVQVRPQEVQVQLKMSVPAQIIKNDPNRAQNRRFGLKIGPEACQDCSGAFGMGLTPSKGPSRTKNIKNCAPQKTRVWSYRLRTLQS